MWTIFLTVSLVAQTVKNLLCNAGDLDSSLFNSLPYCFSFMLCFYWPRGMRDLSSSARMTPALLHWKAKS